MRFGAKAMITGALAGPAMAALMLTGAGAANAATTTPTAHTSSSGQFNQFCNQFQNQFPNQYPGQYPGQFQNQYQNQFPQNQFPRNRFQQGQWNLSGSNTLAVKFEVKTYDYPVYFNQQGTCLTGWLKDPGASFTGQIHGTVYGNFITFSVTYPSGSKQGTRTWNGTISGSGHVSGSWSETGSEVGSGSWWLSNPASQGCQMNFQFNRHHHNHNQACFFGHM
jgi:hypothetical protein